MSHAVAHEVLAVHGCSEVREGASAMEMDAAREIGAIMEMRRHAGRSFLEKEAEAPTWNSWIEKEEAAGRISSRDASPVSRRPTSSEMPVCPDEVSLAVNGAAFRTETPSPHTTRPPERRRSAARVKAPEPEPKVKDEAVEPARMGQQQAFYRRRGSAEVCQRAFKRSVFTRRESISGESSYLFKPDYSLPVYEKTAEETERLAAALSTNPLISGEGPARAKPRDPWALC